MSISLFYRRENETNSNLSQLEREEIRLEFLGAERRDKLCVGLSRFVSAPVYITANTKLFAMGDAARFAAFSDSYRHRRLISSLADCRYPVRSGRLGRFWWLALQLGPVRSPACFCGMRLSGFAGVRRCRLRQLGGRLPWLVHSYHHGCASP